MSLFSLDDHRPHVPPSAYIAPNAVVIGRVSLGDEASVWSCAVLRGDDDHIDVGAGSNVQDGAVLHVDPGCPMRIGRHVSIGHAAVLHGCTVGDGSLVGIHATVLNNAVIGQGSIVAAGALVAESKHFPDRSLILGVPARVARELRPEEVEWVLQNARHYVVRARRFELGLNPLP